MEAHEVGSDDWTTLPDANGHTVTDTGESCAGRLERPAPVPGALPGRGLLADRHHRALERGHRASSGAGRSGRSTCPPYAGKQVELSISYVSDWGTQGLGVFVDDATVTANGATVTTTSFEADLGGWTVAGAAPGSAANPTDWARTNRLRRGRGRHHERHRLRRLRCRGPHHASDAQRPGSPLDDSPARRTVAEAPAALIRKRIRAAGEPDVNTRFDAHRPRSPDGHPPAPEPSTGHRRRVTRVSPRVHARWGTSEVCAS